MQVDHWIMYGKLNKNIKSDTSTSEIEMWRFNFAKEMSNVDDLNFHNDGLKYLLVDV